MFRLLRSSQKLQPSLSLPSRILRSPFKYAFLTTGTIFVVSYIRKLYQHQETNQGQLHIQTAFPTNIQPKYTPNKRTTIISIAKRIIRMIELFLIFFPSIVLFPLRFFKFTEDIWYRTFSWSVQKAGIVWIKCFQYLSHRRDIVGEQLANKFIYLREKSPAHEYHITQKIFKSQFGKQIKQMFDSFDPVPIGIGSVGQVYKAIYKGKKVAVKVRHPDVEKNVESDIDIIFFASRILSKFSSFFQIPITNDSLKKLLINQIDFNVQARNLLTFNEQFKNSKIVRFPSPIVSRESILIEQYISGVPIDYYEKNETVFNREIARNGASIFFQMLMDHNFIHADLHAGNIYVEIKDKNRSLKDIISDKMQLIKEWFESKYVQYYQQDENVKELYFESISDLQQIRKNQNKYNKKVEIMLIDVGMVLMLAEIQRANFTKFVLSVVSKKPQISSEMIYNLSLFKGKHLRDLPQRKEFQEYKQSLYQLFVRLSKIRIKDLQGITLLKGMLDTIREHKMSLEGEFATLLTNILIVEQIGRDINPDINILLCTVPYFKNVELKV